MTPSLRRTHALSPTSGAPSMGLNNKGDAFGSVDKFQEYKLRSNRLDTLLKLRICQGFRVDRVNFHKKRVETSNEFAKPETIHMRFLFRPNVHVEYVVKMSRDNANTADNSSRHDAFSLSVQSNKVLNIEIYLHSTRTFLEQHKKASKRIKAKNAKPSDLISKHLLDFIATILSQDQAAEKLHTFSEQGLNYLNKRNTPTTFSIIKNKYVQEHSAWFAEEDIPLLIRIPDGGREFVMRQMVPKNHDTLPGRDYTSTKTLHLPSQPGSTTGSLRNSLSTESLSQSAQTSTYSQQSCVGHITKFLDSFTSAKVRDNMYIIFLKREDAQKEYSNFVTVKRDNDRSLELGFCILKLTWHSMSIGSLLLRFFNIPREQRFSKKLEIENRLLKIENISLERRHLVRVFSHLPCNVDDLQQYYVQLYNRTPHFSSYMHHKKWMWTMSENSSSVSSILTLIFAKRLREGFQVVSRTDHTAVFLKKIPLKTLARRTQECSLFYCAHFAQNVDQIITEYWLEPLCGHYDNSPATMPNADGSEAPTKTDIEEIELREHIEKHFLVCDSDIISIFCTFDTIWNECQKISPHISSSATVHSDTSVSSASRDQTTIPFNVGGLWKRSTRHAISLPLLEAHEDNELLLRRLHNVVQLTNSVEISTRGVVWDDEANASSTTEQKQFEDPPTVGSHKNSRFLSTSKHRRQSSLTMSHSFSNSDLLTPEDDNFSPPPSPSTPRSSKQSSEVAVPPISFCRTARCYARVTGESNTRFLLTFVPTTVSPKATSVQVVVCECSQQQFFSLENIKTCESPLALFEDSSSSHGTLLAIGSETEFDDSYYHYQHFITETHAHSVTFGLFKSMQKNPSIPIPLLKASVETCVEYAVEIDMSELIESILLSKDYFYNTVAEYECPHDEMSKYFEYLIKKHFMLPEGSEYHFVLREKTDKNASTILSSSNLCLNEFEDVGEELAVENKSDQDNNVLSPNSERLDIITKKSDFFSDTSSNSYNVHQELLSNATKNVALPAFFRMECRVSAPNTEFASSPSSLYSLLPSEHVHNFPTAIIPIEKARQFLLAEQRFENSEQWLRHQLGASSNKSTLKLILISLPPDKFQLVENNCEPHDAGVVRNMLNSHESNRFSYCASNFHFATHDEMGTLDDDMGDETGSALDIAYLPPNLRKLMLRTKRKIQALISKEIINCCLHTSPLSTYILEKVKHHLENLPPQCYGTTPHDLKFVDPVQGPILFDSELTKYKNDKIQILKLGTDYVIKMKRPVNQRPSYYAWHDQHLNDDDYKQNKATIRHSASHPDLLGSDDIIFSPDGTSSEELFSSKEGSVTDEIFDHFNTVDETPYWLIMTVSRNKCSVLFYSPFPITQTQRLFVRDSVQQAITEVNRRVNTLILLNDLHETRVCSDLLLPPSVEDAQIFTEMEISRYDKVNAEDFESGTFKCALVHQLSVGLHSRLSPDIAMKQLGKTVFFSFEVLNRHNVYVCRERNGRVFYIRLAEHHDTDGMHALHVQNKPLSLSRVGNMLSMKKIEEMHSNVDSGSNKVSSGDVRLMIEVYGVDPPSSKITEQLMDSVKNKLSTLNLEILSDLLSKNRRFKLTLADIEYLRPLDAPGDAFAYATIPDFVENQFLFMLFLRQNMSYLNQLRLELSAQVEKDLGYHSPSQTEDDDEFPDYIDFKSLFFSFLYNFKTFERITNEVSIGQGIACIHLTPVNKDKEILTHFPVEKDELRTRLELNWSNVKPRKERVDWNDSNAYPLPLNSMFSSRYNSDDDASLADMDDASIGENSPLDQSSDKNLPQHKNNGLQLLFEIWAKGEVNADALIDRLVLSINHTLCDYLLELNLFSQTLTEQNVSAFLDPFSKIVQRASDLQSPSVNRISFHIFLPKWIMSEFVEHIFSIVKEFEPPLNTKLFKLKEGDDISSPQYAIVGGQFAPRKLQTHENNNEFAQIAFHGSTQFLYGQTLRFVRNCCVVITVSTTNLTIMTYNMRRSRFDDLHGRLNRYMSFTKCRQLLLNSIMHQKLGLFFHSNQRNLSSLIDVQDQVTTKQNIDFKLNLRDVDHLVFSNMKLTTKAKHPPGSQLSGANPHLSLKNRPHLQRHQRSAGGYDQRMVVASSGQIPVQSPDGAHPLSPTDTDPRKKGLNTSKPFNLLLRGIYFTESEIRSPAPTEEPLKFHGRQFKHIIAKNHQETVEKSRVSRIYNYWGKSSLTPANTFSKLSAKDLAIIKKTSRLFHFCRSPFFFNEMRQVIFDPSFLDNIDNMRVIQNKDTDIQMRREIVLHVQLQRSFIDEYSQYLREHLNITENIKERNDSPNACLLQVDGQIFNATKVTVYFQKIIHGGVLLLELCFESVFCSLNMYVSDLYERRNQYKVGLATQKQSRTQFLQHTGHVKHDLHVNSFLYDFHLRKFYQYVVHPEEQFPTIDIVDVLTDFEKYHESPPIYSRNMLAFVRLEESIRIPRDASTKQFFTYIRRYADRYSVDEKKYRKINNAIVIPPAESIKTEYRYLTVVTLNDTKRTATPHASSADLGGDLLSSYHEEVTLQLDLHIICLKDVVPCQPARIEKEKTDLSKLLVDVQEHVMDSINNLVNDTLVLFRLDILWQLTCEKKISPHYFSQLVNMCKRTDAADMFDTSLNSLSVAKDVAWNVLLPEFCKRNSLSFQLETADMIQHLIVLNRECPHIFLDVEYHTSENQISMYLCEKQLSDMHFDDTEDDEQAQFLFEEGSTVAVRKHSDQEDSSIPIEEDILEEPVRLPSEHVCVMVDHFVNEICFMTWELIVKGA
uniref:Uncharacterized protein n=1 Tax=Percolomonas cosmopolitus TaxID=63605 RepID=A0A7S1PFL0_9EUKA